MLLFKCQEPLINQEDKNIMITLEKNQGNVISVTAHAVPSNFVSAFIERFEKWGTIYVLNNSYGSSPTITIDDADPSKSTNSYWIEDFNDFSRETGVNFAVCWIPYINAFTYGHSSLIENGKVVAEGSLVWSVPVAVESLD
jgi:hypothetical protein